MSASHTTANRSWNFPGLPGEPDGRFDWRLIKQASPIFDQMGECPQDARWHAEGDVWTHTKMVCEALRQQPSFRLLPGSERAELYAAALLHDTGKPSCTETDEEGRITSWGHTVNGVKRAQRLLYGLDGRDLPLPGLDSRERILAYIRFHGYPMNLRQGSNSLKTVIAASLQIRCSHLMMLARADAMGRRCADQQSMLDEIDRFGALAKKWDCLDKPFSFQTPHDRLLYLESDVPVPQTTAPISYACKATLVAGLPVGERQSWIEREGGHRPVIDSWEIGRTLRISPARSQGKLMLAARRQAEAHLRKGESFIWNDTHISRSSRSALIRWFMEFKAETEIVYLETPWKVILETNRQSSNVIPEKKLWSLAYQLEVPNITEAHHVSWVSV